ncbi:MAG: hypothetical protein EA381_00800 [Planctomycetaceae bacterium]|nr:MAG: hypothetical protein EA381_00800 [Planctomycetaceae bacterium]
MDCFWTAFVDAKTREKTAKIAAHLEFKADATFHDLEIEPYQKTGHKFRFTTRHDIAEWTAMVFDVMLTAQRMGYRWVIAGGVDEELSLTSTGAQTAGIVMLTCWCWPTQEQDGG